MERIRFDVPSAVVGGILGASAGLLGGYLFSRRALSRRFDERLDSEVGSIKAYYNNKLKELLGERSQEDATLEPDDGEIRSRDDRLAEGPVPVPDVPDRGGEAGSGVMDEPLDWPPPSRDKTKPYVISPAEFSESLVGWQQLSITYYAGDKVLADDAEQPIRDVLMTTGPISREGFGGISEDPSIRYIRNEKLELDFEIRWDDRSYAEAVLNYGNPENPQR